MLNMYCQVLNNYANNCGHCDITCLTWRPWPCGYFKVIATGHSRSGGQTKVETLDSCCVRNIDTSFDLDVHYLTSGTRFDLEKDIIRPGFDLHFDLAAIRSLGWFDHDVTLLWGDIFTPWVILPNCCGYPGIVNNSKQLTQLKTAYILLTKPDFKPPFCHVHAKLSVNFAFIQKLLGNFSVRVSLMVKTLVSFSVASLL